MQLISIIAETDLDFIYMTFQFGKHNVSLQLKKGMTVAEVIRGLVSVIEILKRIEEAEGEDKNVP